MKTLVVDFEFTEVYRSLLTEVYRSLLTGVYRSLHKSTFNMKYIYLKPKETLHFELPNISLLFLSLNQIKYCNELLVSALT